MPPTIQDQCDTRDGYDVQDTPATVPFWIDVLPSGRGTLLRVGGEVDLATAPALHAAAERALAERPGRVHLDLGEVSFLDCAGLGALIAIRNAALLAGAGIPVITASRPVRRLMAVAGVSQLFDLGVPAQPTLRAVDSVQPTLRAVDPAPRALHVVPNERPDLIIASQPTAAGQSWLTPRDVERLPGPIDLPPADVHRDLAMILRDAGSVAQISRPVPVPATPGLELGGTSSVRP
jgi:anti-anti-sigma factor